MIKGIWLQIMSRTAIAAVVVMAAASNVRAVDYANIDVVDGAAPTNTTLPTVSIPAGQSTTAGVSTEGFFIDAGSVVGEIPIRIGGSAANDAAGGVLLAIARETGRFPVDGPSLTVPLSASVSTVPDDDTTSLNTRNASGGLALVTRRAGSNINSATYPAGSASVIAGVMNANLAAAYFPFSQGWQGGTASASINDNPITTFNGSAGITFDPVIGPTNTSNVRPSYIGVGQNFVSIPGVTDSRQQGILFGMAAKNEDNFAVVSADPTGNGWNLMTKNSSTDGTGTGEVDPFSFVFMPLGTPNVTMAVMWGAAGQTGDPTPVLSSGSSFSVVRAPEVGNGHFRLTIPGQSPSTGVLLVGGESNANGSGGLPGDNLVTYRPDGDSWLIVSDDLPTANSTAGQNGQSSEPTPYFHFAFMPFNAPPTGPAAIPAPKWTKNSVFGFRLGITEIDSRGNDNDDFIQGTDPGVPGPDVYGTVIASTPNLNVVPTNMNRGDQRTTVNGAYPASSDGVMFAQISQGLRDNSTGGDGGGVDYGICAVSPAGGQWKVSTSGAGSNLGEFNIDYSVAFFGANSGFEMASTVLTDAVGQASVSLPGVNSLTDGVLMVNAGGLAAAVSNHEDNFVVMNPKTDGSGWDVQNFDNGLFSQVGTAFNYVYLPYTTQNLVAGSVNPDGTLISSTSTSEFSLMKEATGSYLLTVNGRTPSDGTLLLVAGNGAVDSQDNAMVYEPAGNQFRIMGVDLITNAEGEGGGFTTLEDSGFQFAFIDYITPPVAPGSNLLAADFNGDTTVNTADFNAWKGGFGTAAGATKPQGDSDGDGNVDGADFLTWQQQFGSSSAAIVNGAAVPEPSSLLLIAPVTVGAVFRGRRRRHC